MSPVDTESSPELVRAIGRWTLVALVVNSVVGAGIFGLPSNIAKSVGALAPIAYLFGALVTTFTVAVVVELSTQFNRAGGAYLFVREAFGSFVGVQTGFFSWLARVTTAAAILNLMLDYVEGVLQSDWGPYGRSAAVAVTVIGLSVANVRGVRVGSSLSTVFAVVKLVPLIGLVIAGFLMWKSPRESTVSETSLDLGNWIDALVAMIFAFSGFESALIPGSEMKDPRRDAPIAAFTALGLVALLYLLLHLVVMNAVPEMASSKQPLSDAAAVYGGNLGRLAISMAAIISTFGWLCAAVVTAPRLTYAMSREGDFPTVIGAVHSRFRTPWVSILMWAILVVALGIYGDFVWNVVLSVAARLVVYSSMCAAAIRLRYQHPKRDAWRSPIGISAPIAGIGVCVVLSLRLNAEHIYVLSTVGIFAAIAWIAKKRNRPL